MHRTRCAVREPDFTHTHTCCICVRRHAVYVFRAVRVCVNLGDRQLAHTHTYTVSIYVYTVCAIMAGT